jgi:hypothetical protein
MFVELFGRRAGQFHSRKSGRPFAKIANKCQKMPNDAVAKFERTFADWLGVGQARGKGDRQTWCGTR